MKISATRMKFAVFLLLSAVMAPTIIHADADNGSIDCEICDMLMSFEDKMNKCALRIEGVKNNVETVKGYYNKRY